MSPMRLNLIVVGVVVAITAAFTFGLLLPGTRALARRHQALAEKQQEIRADQERLGKVADLYGTLVKMNEELDGLRQRIPSKRQLGEFLNDLAESLRQSEIPEYDLKPRPPRLIDDARLPASLKDAKGTTLVPIRLSFDGTFPKLFDFLKHVESLPRLSQIESVLVKNNPQQPGHIHVDMTINTYRRSDR